MSNNINGASSWSAYSQAMKDILAARSGYDLNRARMASEIRKRTGLRLRSNDRNSGKR